MKKIIVLVALAISTIGFAQKTVKEGVIPLRKHYQVLMSK